jgi:hypothetical protein
MLLYARHHRLAEAQQTAERCAPRARAVGFLATLFLLVTVIKQPLTMVSDPSQSQSLLSSSTSPGFRQDEGLHAVPNDAWDAPQVHDPASEGLQSVDYDGRNGPQALDPASSPEVAYAHYDDHNAEKAGATVSAGDVVQSRQSRRRKWTWIIAIAVVLVVAIAVGVGAGVGLSRQSSGSDKSSVEDAESTSAR